MFESRRYDEGSALPANGALRWLCYTGLMSGYSSFISCNILTGCVCARARAYDNTRGKRRRDERDEHISIDCLLWLAAQISCRAEQKHKNTWQSMKQLQYFVFFFLLFVRGHIFPFPFPFKKKINNKNLELYRLRVDGSCPFCSGSQVWADNCRVCAAETDDYRLYCLSQAQSTLIQQSHLSLIYESRSLSSHTPLYHTCYAHMLAFGFFFPHLPPPRPSLLSVQQLSPCRPAERKDWTAAGATPAQKLGCLWW